MDIREEKLPNGVVRIILAGRLDADTSVDVEEFIRKKMEEDNASHFILDMEKVPFIASAGLRVVLVIAKELRSSKGDVCVAAPQENVKKVFKISGLDNALHMFEDVAAAARSFAG